MTFKTYLVEDSPVIRENLVGFLEDVADATVVAPPAPRTKPSPGCARTATTGTWPSSTSSSSRATASASSRPAAIAPRTRRCVVLSNYATAEMRERSRALGVDAFFDKSAELDQLLDYCEARCSSPTERAASAAALAVAPGCAGAAASGVKRAASTTPTKALTDMSSSIDFKGRVAIVTGAGGGLGRQHALALAARGAKVVVNDLGGARDGSGGSVSAAQAVVDEIKAAGGEAIANGASVTDFEAVQAMVQQAMDAWGRIDILIDNAGILRDKSFAKMELADFQLVMDVHLMGAVHCTKAVWDAHERAELRPHRDDHLVVRPVRQLRPDQLRRGQDGAGRPDADAELEGAKNNIRVNAWRPLPPRA